MKYAALLSLVTGCGFQIGANGVASDASDGTVIDAPDGAPPDPDALIDAPADGAPDAMPDAPGPKRRVKLTFHNGTRSLPLDNFIALIVLDANKVDYAALKAGGANLRFTDPDGSALPYQIDEWVPNGTSYVWVRVPLIDPMSDTDYIYMHYGDPALTDAQDATGTWTGRSAVWHLSQDPGPGGTGDIKDSTGVRNATASAAMVTADSVAGMIGHGLRFGAVNNTDVTASAIALGQYTWTMWIRGNAAPVSGGSNHTPISDGDANFNFAWDHSLAAFVGAAAQRDAIQWRSTAASGLAATTWYFLAGTYDGTNLCIYRDAAAPSCVAAGAPLAPAGMFEIGGASSNAATFSGIVDEVQVSASAQSAARLGAEYQNQHNAPANPFVTFAAPEAE